MIFYKTVILSVGCRLQVDYVKLITLDKCNFSNF